MNDSRIRYLHFRMRKRSYPNVLKCYNYDNLKSSGTCRWYSVLPAFSAPKRRSRLCAYSVHIAVIGRAISVTNMMAGVDWEHLLNRRRAFRMFMFYKMHSGLVAIHPTLYLTPRQYHTSHKYSISHSRIGQHASSFFPSRGDRGGLTHGAG